MAAATEEFFISLVEKNRFLWDKTHKDYKNVKLKEKVWQDIGDICNLSGTDAAGLFNSIRLKYIRRKNELKQLNKSGSGAKILKPWSLFEQLNFLDDTITPRKTISNLLLNKPVEEGAAKISCCLQTEAPPVRENIVHNKDYEFEFVHVEVEQGLVSEDSLMSPTTSSQLSHSPTPNLPSTSKALSSGRPVVKPVSKRKRQDDALDKIAEAITAPIDFGPAQEAWSVSEEVHNFCKYLGNRMYEMPKSKQRKVQMLIMNVLADVEEE